MEFDNTWRAVFEPGASDEFFSPPPPRPLAATSEYSATNAWWLAELSRLVYREGAPRGERSRDGHLAAVSLEESLFLDRRGTQCAVVVPRDERPAPIAALVFRGTDGPVDWRTNLTLAPSAWPPGGRVHAGFKKALDDVWPELEATLDRLAVPIFYAGHSLGGALALLAAGRRPPLAVYSFGAPRVGDQAFAESLAGATVHRVVNRRDIVPRSPPSMGSLRYRHAGEPRAIFWGEPRRGARRAGTPPLPPLPGGRRWFDPPPSFCDHAPVNYVACLERRARATRDAGLAWPAGTGS